MTRRFGAATSLAELFDAAAALGPLPLGEAFSLCTAFPRRVLSKPPPGADAGGGTLEANGIEGQAGLMVIAAD